MKIWDKLDEVILAGMLTTVCVIAMMLGYNGGTVQICITGIVAIAAAKVAKDRKEANNDRRETGKASTF